MANHSIVHVEFAAKDPEAAGKFYSELFGWNVTHDDRFNYWNFMINETSGGGFNQIGGEGLHFIKEGDVIVYISTDDLEGDLAKAASLGGEVVQPKMDIPGMGAMGIFHDPDGNLVGLWTNAGAESSAS